MTLAWRLWVLVLTVLAALVTAYGMRVGMADAWWPIAALWLTTTLAAFGLSIWASGCLILLGLAMDYLGEAPIGAWPLALLSAYAVALVAWDRQPPIRVISAEIISLVGGFIVVSLALGIAGSIAGHPGFARNALTGDFIMTALLYPLVRFLILPASIRVARR
ncbi:MAG: hypothetical protein R3C46_15450 [Hyphomonadaceae bacterium]